MGSFLHLLPAYWGLSPTDYWHLRLLCSISLGPLLAIVYLVVTGERARRKARLAGGGATSLWVGSDGRLLVRPRRQE